MRRLMILIALVAVMLFIGGCCGSGKKRFKDLHQM